MPRRFGSTDGRCGSSGVGPRRGKQSLGCPHDPSGTETSVFILKPPPPPPPPHRSTGEANHTRNDGKYPLAWTTWPTRQPLSTPPAIHEAEAPSGAKTSTNSCHWRSKQLATHWRSIATLLAAPSCFRLWVGRRTPQATQAATLSAALDESAGAPPWRNDTLNASAERPRVPRRAGVGNLDVHECCSEVREGGGGSCLTCIACEDCCETTMMHTVAVCARCQRHVEMSPMVWPEQCDANGPKPKPRMTAQRRRTSAEHCNDDGCAS